MSHDRQVKHRHRAPAIPVRPANIFNRRKGLVASGACADEVEEQVGAGHLSDIL